MTTRRASRSPLGLAVAVAAALALPAAADEPQYVQYEGGDGPGAGMHIVLISGDEEYRSEETLPQLGRILAERHGFKTTVLFAIDDSGQINPDHRTNIPGTYNLDDADLMVIATRFRNLPDEQMQPIDDFLNAGKPVIGMRTATHAFNLSGDTSFGHYSFNHNGDWNRGFGRQILGETWISHHGRNSHEATQGRLADGADDHPILRGVDASQIFCKTNVYAISAQAREEFTTLVHGMVKTGMDIDDEVNDDDDRNNPPMPVAWVNDYTSPDGTAGKAFATTMGSSQGFGQSEHHRRMLVNAAYYLLDMDVPEEANVEIVGAFDPTPFGFGGYQQGMTPADFVAD